MHLLFLTFHLPRPEQAGAARPWEELQMMRELDYRVTVVTSGAHYLTGNIEKPIRGLWRKDMEAGVQIVRTWAPSGYRHSMRRRLLCYLAYSAIAPVASLFVRSVDIVFSGTDPPFMTPGALLASWIHRAPLVLDERDMYPETLIWLGVNVPGPILKVFYLWSRFLSKRARSIVTVSPGFVRLLKERGVDPERISLLLNYFPSGEGETSRETAGGSSSDGSPQTRAGAGMTVLYAGGLGQATELGWLMEAAKVLRDRGQEHIRFVIVGEGEKRQEYEEFCRVMGLSNVEFLGPKPRVEMQDIYQAADVAVHALGSQWRNSLSSKIFEYMGSGLPVVFAGEGDIADVLRESGAGTVVPPGNPAAIADELARLSERPAARLEMSEKARSYIRRNFQRDELRSAFADALAAG